MGFNVDLMKFVERFNPDLIYDNFQKIKESLSHLIGITTDLIRLNRI